MNKLIAVFRRLLKIGPAEQKVESADSSTQTAAVPGRTEPKELHGGKRRLKENYTSHWDLDYLPHEEVEKIMAESKKQRS